MTEQLDQLLHDPVSSLDYRMHAASATDGNGKAPCLLLLHGVGSNEDSLLALARRMDPRLVVIRARGPVVFGPTQFGWFQVSFDTTGPVINPVQAEQSRQQVVTLVEQLPDLHDIDPARIWIAGFSQGGIMSASVALTAPQQVVGFGILSGRILPEVLPLVTPGEQLAKLQAFVSHGAQDEKLGIHFALQSKQVLSDFAIPLTYREYPAGHRLEMAMVADFRQWLQPQLGSDGAAQPIN